MQHYVEMVRSHGTADGYNTEASERLHIDLAKVAYESSNKCDYIPQMKEWLMRRESIALFSSYLDWVAQNEGLSPNLTVPDGRDQPTATSHHRTPASEPRYTITKNCPFPTTTADSIIEDHAAPDFFPCLRSFLSSQSILPPDFYTIDVPFPTFKRFTVHIPPIHRASPCTTADTIRATVARKSPEARQPTKRPFFDTVLARKGAPTDDDSSDVHWSQKLDGTCLPQSGYNANNLLGLHVGQVKVIFSLPPEYGKFREPLVYVEWFTPLHQQDPISGMYKITPSTRQHRRNASIIPVSRVARSCHLIPQFGRSVHCSWKQDNVLGKCSTFFVNPYLRHIDFVLFRDV